MAGASNPDALDAHFKLYFMFSKVQQRTRSQFKPSKRRRRGWVERGAASTVSVLRLPSKTLGQGQTPKELYESKPSYL